MTGKKIVKSYACYDDCKHCDKECGYCRLDKQERSCPFVGRPDWCPKFLNEVKK